MSLLDDKQLYAIMQKLRPQEVDVLTYPNGAHMTFGASSLRVTFLDV
jgi:hypothetical protein